MNRNIISKIHLYGQKIDYRALYNHSDSAYFSNSHYLAQCIFIKSKLSILYDKEEVEEEEEEEEKEEEEKVVQQECPLFQA